MGFVVNLINMTAPVRTLTKLASRQLAYACHLIMACRRACQHCSICYNMPYHTNPFPMHAVLMKSPGESAKVLVAIIDLTKAGLPAIHNLEVS